jgi:hypothetical protein
MFLTMNHLSFSSGRFYLLLSGFGKGSNLNGVGLFQIPVAQDLYRYVRFLNQAGRPKRFAGHITGLTPTKITNIDDLPLLLEDIGKTVFRQTPMQWHLTALTARISTVSAALAGTFVAAPGSFAQSAARSATHAPAFASRSFSRAQRMQLECFL